MNSGGFPPTGANRKGSGHGKASATYASTRTVNVSPSILAGLRVTFGSWRTSCRRQSLLLRNDDEDSENQASELGFSQRQKPTIGMQTKGLPVVVSYLISVEVKIFWKFWAVFRIMYWQRVEPALSLFKKFRNSCHRNRFLSSIRVGEH